MRTPTRGRFGQTDYHKLQLGQEERLWRDHFNIHKEKAFHCSSSLLGPMLSNERICLHWYCHLEVQGAFLVCLCSESQVLSASVPDAMWSSSPMAHTNLLLSLTAAGEKVCATWAPSLVTRVKAKLASFASSWLAVLLFIALFFLSHFNGWSLDLLVFVSLSLSIVIFTVPRTVPTHSRQPLQEILNKQDTAQSEENLGRASLYYKMLLGTEPVGSSELSVTDSSIYCLYLLSLRMVTYSSILFQ